jgi:hypothetical protein
MAKSSAAHCFHLSAGKDLLWFNSTIVITFIMLRVFRGTDLLLSVICNCQRVKEMLKLNIAIVFGLVLTMALRPTNLLLLDISNRGPLEHFRWTKTQ